MIHTKHILPSFIFQNISYNRETIDALNYEIQQMSFIPFYATQIITRFLIQGSQPIMIK